ncbi:putative ribonuclease H-like domain-containing protein [Tanacetum coccineum]
MMTQKLGDGFDFKKKACSVCGSLNHLIKDCNFYENKMVGKSVLNNKAAILAKSGQALVNTAKQSSHRATISVSTARHVNTAAQRPNVNDALSPTYFKAHSSENAVKSSACWIWRPTGNVIDHNSKDSGSYMLKRFDYVDLQGKLKTKGFLTVDALDILKETSPSLQIIKILMVDLLHLQEVLKDVKLLEKDNMYSFDLKNVVPSKVAERKNRTLIEAARTMLADSLLPTTFWAEAINTACYFQNRVLVTKPHNKTPYKLLIGRPPKLDFMRPFGCPVTILNTLDHLGKFDWKADEGFLVGYSVNSKAFRLFNTRTRKVEENLHIKFLENKSNVAGSGLEWLFDIDSLTKSMNYEPVTTGNQTNDNAGIEANVNARPARQEKASDHKYILLPFMLSNSPLSSNTQNSDDKDADDVPGKGYEGVNNASGSDDQEMTDSSTQNINTARPSINTASSNINIGSLNINIVSPNDSSMPSLEEIGIFGGAYDDEDVGAEADLNNLETTMNVIQALTDPSWIEAIQEELLKFKLQKVWTLVDLHKGKRAIGTKIEAIRLFLAYASFMGFIMYQIDVKSAFLYGTIEEEVHVCQPLGFEDLQFPNKVYKVEKALYGLHQAPRAWYKTLSTYLLESRFRRGTIDKTVFIKKDRGDILLVQVYVDDIIFGSTRKSLCIEFEQMMHNRFQMSLTGELTFFLGMQVQQKKDGIFISQDKYVADIFKKFDFVTVKTTSTPIETNKALIKDEKAENVDVHLYRSMIGSLMYLTASRPNMMFDVCACARELPFDLEAFFDSDYAGASLDRKSTTGGCQFLSKRLISWQCKKYTIVANSNTEAEYVTAANCCGQVLWIQNQMLDYGFNFMNTKIYIGNESTICIMKNPVFHSKTKHIKIRHHFIIDSYEKKLIQVIKIHTDHNVADLLTKAFNVSRFNFLIASIGLLNL